MGANQSQLQSSPVQSYTESEVTKRFYTVYFHKTQSNIGFEVWDDTWDFVHEPNNASKKHLKDSGTSIEKLLQNGQFTQHKASFTPGTKRKRTKEEKNRLPQKKKPKILKEKKDLGDWKISTTPPTKGKIKPLQIKLRKTKHSKTDNTVKTSKSSMESQGKCTPYFF